MTSEEFIETFGADRDTLVEMADLLDILAADLLLDSTSEAQGAYKRVQYYVFQMSFEIRSLFAAIANITGREHHYSPIDKYLSLLVYETVEVVPKLTGHLIRTLSLDGGDRYDGDAIKEGLHEFMEEARRAPVDRKALAILRNSAIAHHLDREGKLEVLAEWYSLSRITHARGLSFLDMKLNVYAAHIERCLAKFSRVIATADKERKPEDIKPIG